MSTRLSNIPLAQIQGYSEVADFVAGRPLYQFGGVASFCYRRQTEAETSLEIELVMQEQEPPHRQVGFRFRGVRDVQFSGWGSIVGLYFQNIKDRGWEDAHFEVGDYEQGGIHLFCDEILVYDPKRVA